MKERIFAADDWGFSPAINAGVLELARKGWLRSVSCAANVPHLTNGLDELKSHVANGVQVALHFNLTYGKPLATAHPSLVDAQTGEFHPHRRLMLKALLGRIDADAVRAEFGAQLRVLRELGLDVRRLDGHHHVHLLPGVASALQPLLSQCGIGQLRVMNDPQHIFSFAQTVFFRTFIDRNDSKLEGCAYLLPGHLRSRSHLRRKIARAGTRALLVHPALYDDFAESGMRDAMTDYRVFELQTVLKLLNE